MKSASMPSASLTGRVASLFVGLALACSVHAQGNLEIDTPAIPALRKAMQQRHAQLAPLYAAGAVGIAADGTVSLRDAAAVPLAQRAQANAAVAAENADRAALYREIARANGHPEWEAEVRRTFAQRWVDRAQPGWWVQKSPTAPPWWLAKPAAPATPRRTQTICACWATSVWCRSKRWHATSPTFTTNCRTAN